MDGCLFVYLPYRCCNINDVKHVQDPSPIQSWNVCGLSCGQVPESTASQSCRRPFRCPLYLLSPPTRAQSPKFFLCRRMSTKPGLDSKKRNGLPTKSLLGSSLELCGPSLPSRSTLPAHTRHCMGLSCCVPRTRPRVVISSAAIVSMVISTGRAERVGCEVAEARRAWKLENSWAE